MSVRASVGRIRSLSLSVAALMLAASGVIGAPVNTLTVTVNRGPVNLVTEGGGPYDALTNAATIANGGAGMTVQSSGNVSILHNTAAGTITATGSNTAIGLGTTAPITVNAFVNDGQISGTTAVQIGNDVPFHKAQVGTFDNTATGQITGQGDGVLIVGDVMRFANAGWITSTAGTAVDIGFNNVTIGTVGTFSNSGHIQAKASGIDFFATVTDFSNGGEISGEGVHGVEFRGQVTSFRNAAGGTISGGSTADHGFSGVAFESGVSNFITEAGSSISGVNAVYVLGGTTGLFDNAGDIGGTDGYGHGVWFDSADVTTFRNEATGRIWSSGPDGAANFEGTVGSFLNAGQIWNQTNGFLDGDGVDFKQHVGSFANTGSIAGTNGGANFDFGVDNFFNSGTVNGGSYGYGFNGEVGTFLNTGAIIGGVIFSPYSAPGVALGSFRNEGTISAQGIGVILDGFDVDTFTNVGTIEATDATYGNGIQLAFGSIATFTNAGTITGAGSPDSAAFIAQASQINSFTNTATGRLVGAFGGFAAFDTDIGQFTNAGYIGGAGFAGIALSDSDVTIVNTGTIEGAAGILYDGTYSGSGNVTNSGTIRGTAGTAIDFAFEPPVTCGCGPYPQLARDDTLTISTGSKIFGTVNFGDASGDANDTLDFSGFAGNTVLDVPGLDGVVPGTRGFVWDKPNDKIAIFDLSGLGGGAIGEDWSQIGQSMFEAARTETQDWSGLNPGGSTPLGFVETPTKTAAQQATETAVMTELDTTQHLGLHGWASVIGGGSGVQSPIDRNAAFAGLIAGTHARLTQMLTLGGMGGVVQSTSSSLNGDEVLNTTTGSIGLYGSAQFGVADVDFSLLAGLGLNQSNRRLVAGGTTETAVGNFTSGVLTPMLAVSVPVLSADGGSISLEASGSYTGGIVSGYSETGSSMNLTVGAQTIAVLDARLGLAAKTLISTTAGATYAITAKAGVFATSNVGRASVPVTVFGQTTQLATPGSTAYGLYTGLGAEGAITQTLHLGAHLDGSWRTDSVIAASAKLTLGGTF